MFPLSHISTRRLGGATLAFPTRAVANAVTASVIILGISAALVDPGGAWAASHAPAIVKGEALPASSPAPYKPAGTVVSSSRVGMRVFINNSHGFALATGVAQADYPVATADGGRTWRIAGPVLHRNAANAPDVVTQVGAARSATYFAYGGPGGGNSVAVTRDGGKHWWRAYLYGAVYAVVPIHTVSGASGLLAFGNGPGAYCTSNGGRVWHYKSSVLAIR